MCLEERIGVPDDMVGSWAPEEGDVRHCGKSLDGGNRWWQDVGIGVIQRVGGVRKKGVTICRLYWD